MARPEVFTFISNKKLSWVLQLMSCFFWVSSFIYPNEKRMHPLETSLSRAIVCLIANYAIMKYQGGTMDLRDPKTNFYATYRSVTNTFQGMIVAFLMFYIPMPIIHTISSSSSAFTAGIEHYCYGLDISNRSKVLIVVSIFGVMLQANGEHISHAIWSEGQPFRPSDFENYEHISLFQSILLSFAFLCYVCVWSYGLVIVKHVKMAFYQLNLHNNIVLVFVTGLSYFFVSDQERSSLSVLAQSLLFSGTLVMLAQLTFVLALMICKSVGIMMVLNTANIAIAYCYSMIRYDEQVDLLSTLGMLVTLTCIFFIVSDRYS